MPILPTDRHVAPGGAGSERSRRSETGDRASVKPQPTAGSDSLESPRSDVGLNVEEMYAKEMKIVIMTCLKVKHKKSSQRCHLLMRTRIALILECLAKLCNITDEPREMMVQGGGYAFSCVPVAGGKEGDRCVLACRPCATLYRHNY